MGMFQPMGIGEGKRGGEGDGEGEEETCAEHAGEAPLLIEQAGKSGAEKARPACAAGAGTLPVPLPAPSGKRPERSGQNAKSPGVPGPQR